MSNIIDMASFRQLATRKPGSIYTCPKTGVIFPQIYKMLSPDAELEGDVPVHTGAFTSHYQLSATRQSGNSSLPGFPPSSVSPITTLEATDSFYLELLHFSSLENAKGFRSACLHLGMDLDEVSMKKEGEGAFILLTRADQPSKAGHIIYRCRGKAYVEAMRAEIECDYAAAFDSKGSPVSIDSLSDGVLD